MHNKVINFLQINKLYLIHISDLFLFICSFLLSNLIRVGDINIFNTNYLIFFIVSYFLYVIFIFIYKFNEIRFTFFNIDTIKIIFKIYFQYTAILFSVVLIYNPIGFPRSLSLIFPAVLFISITYFRLFVIFLIIPKKDKINEKKKIAIFLGLKNYNFFKNLPSIINNYKITFIASLENSDDKNYGYVDNIKIIPFEKITVVLENKNIDAIIIGDKNISLSQKLKLSELNIKIYEIHNLFEENNNRLKATLKKIDHLDFIGRDERKFNSTSWSNELKNKNILITGAGGTIGTGLAKTLLGENISKLYLCDVSEYSLWRCSQEILELKEIEKNNPKIDIEYILLDFTNNDAINNALSQKKIDFIFHAAAYKHVEIVEKNSKYSVYNNIKSTHNIGYYALNKKIPNFVLISSDKAVEPINIMGFTKRICEKIILNLLHVSENTNITNYNIVRFGNVIGSSGSLLEILERKKNKKIPFYLYNKDSTRFFMTQKECSSLIIDVALKSKNNRNKIHVLEMGKNFKIYDLVKNFLNYECDDLTDINKMIKILPGRNYEKKDEKLNYKNLEISEFNKNILYEKDYALTGAKYLKEIEILLKDLYILNEVDLKKILNKLIS